MDYKYEEKKSETFQLSKKSILCFVFTEPGITKVNIINFLSMQVSYEIRLLKRPLRSYFKTIQILHITKLYDESNIQGTCWDIYLAYIIKLIVTKESVEVNFTCDQS